MHGPNDTLHTSPPIPPVALPQAFQPPPPQLPCIARHSSLPPRPCSLASIPGIGHARAALSHHLCLAVTSPGHEQDRGVLQLQASWQAAAPAAAAAVLGRRRCLLLGSNTCLKGLQGTRGGRWRSDRAEARDKRSQDAGLAAALWPRVGAGRSDLQGAATCKPGERAERHSGKSRTRRPSPAPPLRAPAALPRWSICVPRGLSMR